jgi:hypothetical protein
MVGCGFHAAPPHKTNAKSYLRSGMEARPYETMVQKRRKNQMQHSPHKIEYISVSLSVI